MSSGFRTNLNKPLMLFNNQKGNKYISDNRSEPIHKTIHRLPIINETKSDNNDARSFNDNMS